MLLVIVRLKFHYGRGMDVSKNGEGVRSCLLLFSFLHYLTRPRHEEMRLPFSENSKTKILTLYPGHLAIYEQLMRYAPLPRSS